MERTTQHLLVTGEIPKSEVVYQELYRVEDFAFDSVVLSLASYSKLNKILSLNSPDVVNMSATIFSLVFLRLRLFAINSRK